MDEDEKNGIFHQEDEANCVHRFQRGILSSDENFIIFENVSDCCNRTKTNIVFEKIIIGQPLFDNESFCFVQNLYD